MGFPLKVIQADIPEVASALSKLPRSTFLHNAQDPLGSGEAVGEYLQAHTTPARYALMALPGDTHNYVDFDLITKLTLDDLSERLEHPYYLPY